jgi:BlaI family penicillinase repressor
MKSTPRISDREWEIMRVIWREHPIMAAAVIERLVAEDASWHPKTVRTLLARLLRKRVLDYQKHGRVYMYEPLVTEQQCVATASESFLDRVFRGSLKPMMAHFVEQRRLSQEELTELRRLLDEAGGGTSNTPRRK